MFYSHKFRNPYETTDHDDRDGARLVHKKEGTGRIVYRKKKKKIPEVLINTILQRTKYKWFATQDSWSNKVYMLVILLISTLGMWMEG